LKTIRGVLVDHVALTRIVETPVDERASIRSGHEGVADLVKDHLRQSVVRVELLGARNPEGFSPIPGRIRFVRALDPHP
jgi:hypothetical protein